MHSKIQTGDVILDIHRENIKMDEAKRRVNALFNLIYFIINACGLKISFNDFRFQIEESSSANTYMVRNGLYKLGNILFDKQNGNSFNMLFSMLCSLYANGENQIFSSIDYANVQAISKDVNCIFSIDNIAYSNEGISLSCNIIVKSTAFSTDDGYKCNIDNINYSYRDGISIGNVIISKGKNVLGNIKILDDKISINGKKGVSLFRLVDKINPIIENLGKSNVDLSFINLVYGLISSMAISNISVDSLTKKIYSAVKNKGYSGKYVELHKDMKYSTDGKMQFVTDEAYVVLVYDYINGCVIAKYYDSTSGKMYNVSMNIENNLKVDVKVTDDYVNSDNLEAKYWRHRVLVNNSKNS